MDTLSGTVKVRRKFLGTRSEGNYSVLSADDGRTFTLYRRDTLAMDDPFFMKFDCQRITVDGTAEASGYFFVSALRREDGSPVPFPSGFFSLWRERELGKPRGFFPKKEKKRGGRR